MFYWEESIQLAEPFGTIRETTAMNWVLCVCVCVCTQRILLYEDIW